MYPRGNGGNGGPRGPPMQSNTNANNVAYGGSMGQQSQQGYAQAVNIPNVAAHFLFLRLM
jgi:hypothetical protein